MPAARQNHSDFWKTGFPRRGSHRRPEITPTIHRATKVIKIEAELLKLSQSNKNIQFEVKKMKEESGK